MSASGEDTLSPLDMDIEADLECCELVQDEPDPEEEDEDVALFEDDERYR